MSAYRPAQVAKAIAAALVACSGGFATAASGGMTTGEFVGVVLTALAAAAAVFATPNAAVKDDA